MEQPREPGDDEVDAVIAEFDGDVRAAIRALLHDLAVLAADFSASVSRGYVRGRPPLKPHAGQHKRSGTE